MLMRGTGVGHLAEDKETFKNITITRSAEQLSTNKEKNSKD